MILGHGALALLLRKTSLTLSPIPKLLLATYGPDLIDKACMLTLGTPSKWIGHTVLTFIVVALILTWPSARRRHSGCVGMAAAMLWAAHLILDLTEPVILFWPFLGPFPPNAPYDLSEGFIAFYSGHGSMAVLVLDLACITAAFAALALGWKHRKRVR